MATQCQDASARATHIPQQQLQDRGAPDHLHATRVLRPTECVTNGTGFVGPRCFAEGSGGMKESVLGKAAVLFDHLGRVTRKMLAQQLENTTRMLQRAVLLII